MFREAGSDRHLLFLTAGGNRVDPAKAAALAGAPLEKADAASIRAVTGFAIGGVAPLGHLQPDRRLARPAAPRLRDGLGRRRHAAPRLPGRARALAAAIGATVADFTA